MKHQPEGGFSTERTERTKKKEIKNLNFYYFLIHLFYSFTKRRYSAGGRLVDRCLE